VIAVGNPWNFAGASNCRRQHPAEIAGGDRADGDRAVAVRSKQDSGQAKQDTLCGKAGQRIRGAS